MHAPKSCQNGNHNFIVLLYADNGYDSDAVARWCQDCGCAVVDIDHDNRTKPGAVMPIRAPKILHEKSRQV